jgi:hypothetical protein
LSPFGALGGADGAGVEDADVREQTGQDRPVHARGVGGGAVGGRARLRTHELAQLPVHVGPLAHAHVVEELAAAQASEGAGAEVALLLLQVVPEVEG